MVIFQDLFMKTRGKPIEYKGKILYMTHEFPTEGCLRFELTFESTSSEWKQGVGLDAEVDIMESGIKSRKMAIWEAHAPTTVEISLDKPTDVIHIKNLWETHDGVVHSWHNGAAMAIEEIDNGVRYYCNDGHPDDDLDDLIFTFERVL